MDPNRLLEFSITSNSFMYAVSKCQLMDRNLANHISITWGRSNINIQIFLAYSTVKSGGGPTNNYFFEALLQNSYADSQVMKY